MTFDPWGRADRSQAVESGRSDTDIRDVGPALAESEALDGRLAAALSFGLFDRLGDQASAVS